MELYFVAILGYLYVWLKAKKSLEIKNKRKYTYQQLFEEKDDEIFYSLIAMIIIMIVLPIVSKAVAEWINIKTNTVFDLAKVLVSLMAGTAGTFFIDKTVSAGKNIYDKKLKNKLK
jgi:Ca2+/Na+ antiporter